MINRLFLIDNFISGINTKMIFDPLERISIQHGYDDPITMGGSGWLGNVKHATDLAKKAGKAYSSDIATFIKNALPASDENAAKQYPGENHAILKLPNNKLAFANYMGPGTNLITRLKKGDKPRTESDKVARQHDIRYALSKTDADVRAADKKMVQSLKKIQAAKKDSSLNTQIGIRGIQSKMVAEDLGLIPKNKFATKNKVRNKDEEEFLEDKLKMFEEQTGYGKKPKPADELRQSILKGLKQGSGLKTAGSGLKTAGSGLKVAGDGLKTAGSGIKSGAKHAEKHVHMLINGATIAQKKKLADLIGAAADKHKGMSGTGLFSSIGKAFKKVFGKTVSHITDGVLKMVITKLPIHPAGKFVLSEMLKSANLSGKGSIDKKVQEAYHALKQKIHESTGIAMSPDVLKKVRAAAKKVKDKEALAHSMAHIFMHHITNRMALKNMKKQKGGALSAGGGSPADKEALKNNLSGMTKDLGNMIHMILSNDMSGDGFWGSIKKAFSDFGEGFKYGWNKTLGIARKLPIPYVQQAAQMIPDLPKSKVYWKNGKLMVRP